MSLDDDEPPPLEAVVDPVDWDLPDLEPVDESAIPALEAVAALPAAVAAVKVSEISIPKPLEETSSNILDTPTKSKPKSSYKKSRSALKAEEMKNLGNDAIREGDYDKAIKLYSQAIALDKVNLDREGSEGYLLYCNRAKAYMTKTPVERRQFKWALKDAEMAIKIKPNFAKAHYRAAIALEGLGEEEKAIVKYCKVAEFVPGDVSIAKKLSNLVRYKPDVVYMTTVLLNSNYSHFTAFLDITSAYMCKLLSPKPEEYAKVSKDKENKEEVKDENSSFEEQVKARQIIFVENNGENVATLLTKAGNKRLKHYGKKFHKIVKCHKS